jgi:hypothetical protein
VVVGDEDSLGSPPAVGEGARDVAEDGRFEQRRGDRGHVDGCDAAPQPLRDLGREELLAGTGLAPDQDGSRLSLLKSLQLFLDAAKTIWPDQSAQRVGRSVAPTEVLAKDDQCLGDAKERSFAELRPRSFENALPIDPRAVRGPLVLDE